MQNFNNGKHSIINVNFVIMKLDNMLSFHMNYVVSE
jgi:hypothetical protein